MVHLRGHVELITDLSANHGCPCTFFGLIRDMTTGATSVAQFQTFASPTPYFDVYSFDVEALFAATPGPRTYQLEAGLDGRADDLNDAIFNLHSGSSLSAQTFPFGPAGTSDF